MSPGVSTRYPPRTWPGLPRPLGATWDGEGVNVAVFSEGAAAVELCLLDGPPDGPPDGRLREERLTLEEQSLHVWHGYVPGVSPGQRYGLRVHGDWDPARDRRWNPAKLLVDPYARALCGDVTGHPSTRGDSPQDSAAHVPHGVVVHDDFPWGDEQPPRTPYAESVLYELHVKGFTVRHPEIPPALRGTYAGLAHPAAIGHLVSLGVTAVELLPVHHFVSEPHLLRRGLRNYWGYNSLGYFAPHAAYSASGDRGEQVREFKAMVRALHRAGIEVILDVVYNHTAEGDGDGPTLAFRGYDNPTYYRLAADRSRYRDYTGCGNTLDTTDSASTSPPRWPAPNTGWTGSRRSSTSCSRTRSSTPSSSSPSRGTSATAAIRWGRSRRSGPSGTAGTATPCARSGCARARARGPRHSKTWAPGWPARPTSSRAPAAARARRSPS